MRMLLSSWYIAWSELDQCAPGWCCLGSSSVPFHTSQHYLHHNFVVGTEQGCSVGGMLTFKVCQYQASNSPHNINVWVGSFFFECMSAVQVIDCSLYSMCHAAYDA